MDVNFYIWQTFPRRRAAKCRMWLVKREPARAHWTNFRIRVQSQMVTFHISCHLGFYRNCIYFSHLFNIRRRWRPLRPFRVDRSNRVAIFRTGAGGQGGGGVGVERSDARHHGQTSRTLANEVTGSVRVCSGYELRDLTPLSRKNGKLFFFYGLSAIFR